MFKKRLLLVSSLLIASLASVSVSAQQLAVPDSDVSKGGFKATSGNNQPLWADIDEKLTADDTDYIYSGKGASTAEVTLSNVTDPNSDTGHIIRFKARRTGASASVELQLWEVVDTNNVLRASTGVRTPGTANTWEVIPPYTLSPGEADAIVDYNNLSFRIISSSVGNNDEIEITWMELEVPNAVSAVAPTVSSPTHANVTDNSAVLGGTVTDLGTPASLTNCGIEWGLLADQPNWPNRVIDALPCAAVNDTFTVSVPGLPAETAIYYRAWANNGLDGFSLEGGPFTTLAAATLPAVTTSAAADITQNSARLGGNVTNDGGDPGVTRGIYLQEDNPGSENGLQVTMGTGTGLFDQVVSNLPAGALIYFRAYANNSAGERLGNELFFTTQSGPPTVDSPTAVVLSATTATLGGTMTSDGGVAPDVGDCGVEWGTVSGGPYPNPVPDLLAACEVDNPFTVSVGSLPTGTTVYFRAYATNSQGTGYSAQAPFTPSGPPVVSATPVAPASITLRSATLDGEVTNEGGSPVIERGFYWDTAQPPEAAGTKVVVNTNSGTGAFSRTIDGLSPGTRIFWKAYATNSVTTGYSAQEQFDTLAEPTVQASNLQFPVLSGRSMRITWGRGDGDGVIVVMRLDGAGRTDPQDGNDYIGESDYSNLPQELPPGSSGNFVMYKGPGTSVVVNGLANLTTYRIAIYEYATTPLGPNYLVTPIVEAPATTKDFAVHNYDYGIDCGNCHDHGSFNSRGDELKAICETCHTPLGDAAAKLEFDNHLTPNKNPGIDQVDCGMCHELHNISRDVDGNPVLTGNTTLSVNSITSLTEHNKSFLRANVDKYFPAAERPLRPEAFLHNDTPKRTDGETVTQEAVTPERAVEGGDNSATGARGYCQVCHTLTNYHRYNPASASEPAANDKGLMQCHDGGPDNLACATEVHCGDCHEHNNTFVGVNDNVPCEDCHNSIQGTRPVITTQFDLASTHIPTAVPSNAVQANCLVCHDQSGHTGGAVSVWNADNMSTAYTQPNPGTDPLATGEGEVFAQHCMSCHEDQTPATPFTGSGLPPKIDSVLWSNSSHDRPIASFPSSTPMTCVGDGANGCHGSGHGSVQPDLLAPAAEGSTVVHATTFCTNCHDGTPASDVLSQFQPAVDDRVDGGSYLTANKKHDVLPADQTYSSTNLSCKGCHNPHADNAADPVSIPGTVNPLNTYSTATYDPGCPTDCTQIDPVNPPLANNPGYTEPDYIEFCLTCHDGTAPNGVTMPAMTDIAATYATSQHGSGSDRSTQKGWLKYPFTNAPPVPAPADYDDGTAPYAPLNCNTCHASHGSENIFNLRSSITVAGVQMTTGGTNAFETFRHDPTGNPPYDGTTYELPLGRDNTQEQLGWGAWCSFCHDVNHDTKDGTGCQSSHLHGASGNF